MFVIPLKVFAIWRLIKERNCTGHTNRVRKYIFCYEIIKYAVQAPMHTGSFSMQSTLITQLNRKYVKV
jgi:hypothetical protein